MPVSFLVKIIILIDKDVYGVVTSKDELKFLFKAFGERILRQKWNYDFVKLGVLYRVVCVEVCHELDPLFELIVLLDIRFRIVAIHVSTDLREELFILGEDWVVCESHFVWLSQRCCGSCQLRKHGHEVVIIQAILALKRCSRGTTISHGRQVKCDNWLTHQDAEWHCHLVECSSHGCSLLILSLFLV